MAEQRASPWNLIFLSIYLSAWAALAWGLTIPSVRLGVGPTVTRFQALTAVELVWAGALYALSKRAEARVALALVSALLLAASATGAPRVAPPERLVVVATLPSGAEVVLQDSISLERGR